MTKSFTYLKMIYVSTEISFIFYSKINVEASELEFSCKILLLAIFDIAFAIFDIEISKIMLIYKIDLFIFYGMHYLSSFSII